MTVSKDSPTTDTPADNGRNKYRLLVEGIDLVRFTTDSQGNYTYVSPRVESLTGFTPDELIGKNIATMVTAAEGARLLSHFQEVLAGKSSQADYTILHKNGTLVNVRSIAWPVMTTHDVTGMIGTVSRVSTGKQSEGASEVTGETGETDARYSRDGVLISDEKGVLIAWNPAMELLTGIRHKKAVGRPLWDILYEIRLPEERVLPLRTAILDHFQSLLGTETPVVVDHSPEYEIERPDRTRRTVESFQFVIPTAKGNGMAVIVRDVTHHKKSTDALKQANRQLNLMTGITRHDITNKITALFGYLTIAEMKFTDPALQVYFQKMELVAQSIQSQIEFTRTYEDLGIHEPQWQDLHEILPYPHVPKQIVLTSEVQGIRVFADLMLERVFFNLLDNTTRHGGEHVTKITVSSMRIKKGLVVVWEDDGVGVPEYAKDQIFDRGFGKNTGLGLFLVREILSLTGITIKETGTHGKGARFEMMVPNGAFRYVGEADAPGGPAPGFTVS